MSCMFSSGISPLFISKASLRWNACRAFFGLFSSASTMFAAAFASSLMLSTAIRLSQSLARFQIRKRQYQRVRTNFCHERMMWPNLMSPSRVCANKYQLFWPNGTLSFVVFILSNLFFRTVFHFLHSISYQTDTDQFISAGCYFKVTATATPDLRRNEGKRNKFILLSRLFSPRMPKCYIVHANGM